MLQGDQEHKEKFARELLAELSLELKKRFSSFLTCTHSNEYSQYHVQDIRQQSQVIAILTLFEDYILQLFLVWHWHENVSRGFKSDVTVFVCTWTRTSVMEWEDANRFPTKVSIPKSF